jgi:hypothetical protein
VAFCFYNLSSIVNGLVYFDQISLLPASHLLLVTVGIFILLGGVWAVSLQAVIVDSWAGGDDFDVSFNEDGTVDEGSLPECDPSPALPVPQSPERERVRSHSESATSPPPQSPLSPRRRTLHIKHSSMTGTMPMSSPPFLCPCASFLDWVVTRQPRIHSRSAREAKVHHWAVGRGSLG